jgi:hypothetical protein
MSNLLPSKYDSIVEIKVVGQWDLKTMKDANGSTYLIIDQSKKHIFGLLVSKHPEVYSKIQ